MKQFRVHVLGFTVDGLWWRIPARVEKYAASIQCPRCSAKYVSKPLNTVLKAQTKVKNNLNTHLKRKHK